MLNHEMVERLRSLEGGTYPVLSVYLGLRPGFGELRSIPARLKDLVSPIRAELGELPHDAAMSLRHDVDAVLAMTDRIAGDLGRGIAIFKSSGAGIDEYLSLPGSVRDRAAVDDRPYVAPLDAELEYFHRYCAVVVDRRKASIFRFAMGVLESWEEMAEEEVRKPNYGGFAGYEEHRVRNRNDEIALRHYRETVVRLVQLHKETGFDLLLIGGPQPHVEGLVGALPDELRRLLAGTFTIDPGTMTPALVRDRCETLADEYDRASQEALVERLLDTAAAGGLATIGVSRVIDAANLRAVDLLVLQAGEATQGGVCVECGWVTGGDEPVCVACGAAIRTVPDLLDAVAHSVRDAGGSVQHILTKTRLVDHEAGAMLRFPVAPPI